MNRSSFWIAISALFVICGCSVKEVRDGCPCRLLLDMTSVDIMDQYPFTLCVFSDDGFDYRTVMNIDNFEDTCVVDVPRTGLEIVVWSGDDGCMNDNGLVIPLGQECPPIYIYSSEIDADGESVYDEVILKKNFCLLNVSVEASHEVSGMRITGGVDGFDKLGKPHFGEFSVSAQINDESSPSFYIPRQDDTPLYLDVAEVDGKVRRFPLHDYISEFGYDWSANDLNDLNMVLNYTPVGVTITIHDWEEEITIDVVI